MSMDFDQSKKLLSGYGYALCHSMECAAAWICRLPEYQDKILVGEIIGVSGLVLTGIIHRLRELIEPDIDFVASSDSYANWLNELSEANDTVTIRSSLLGIFEDLRVSMDWHARNLDMVANMPTYSLLVEAIRHLVAQIAAMTAAGWDSGPAAVSIARVEDSASTWPGAARVPNLVDWPARPSALTKPSAKQMPSGSASLDTDAGLVRFFHFMYAEIEVPAIEVCARNIAEYGRTMPLAFMLDMSRQCWDEARHARLAERQLAKVGGQLGCYPFTNKVWLSYMKGATLAERLAIQQVIDEGAAMGSIENIINEATRVNRRHIADLLTHVLADETVHVSFGNKWIQHCSPTKAAAWDVVGRASRNLGHAMPLASELNPKVRKASGYDFWEDFNRDARRAIPA
jgi:uncharacterized ferritin-like protein (DUF455 family)